jgi:hypothetical protein
MLNSLPQLIAKRAPRLYVGRIPVWDLCHSKRIRDIVELRPILERVAYKHGHRINL